MKFTTALLLMAGSTEATKLKSQAQMMAEIEAMSMNANMHQVGLREKTLLKTYLEVDMNEFLQEKMDSELFEGVSEQNKAQFVGNFFHFVKCRFQDCNLVQTKSKINMKKKSEEKSDTKQPSIADSKAAVDAENEADWAKNGNGTGSQSKKDTAYVQTDAKVNTDESRKAKQTTNTSAQVAADLEKEKSQELVKPHAKADNEKDTEPTNVQIKSEVKVEEKK